MSSDLKISHHRVFFPALSPSPPFSSRGKGVTLLPPRPLIFLSIACMASASAARAARAARAWRQRVAPSSSAQPMKITAHPNASVMGSGPPASADAWQEHKKKEVRKHRLVLSGCWDVIWDIRCSLL